MSTDSQESRGHGDIEELGTVCFVDKHLHLEIWKESWKLYLRFIKVV